MACTQGSLGSTGPLGRHSERLLGTRYMPSRVAVQDSKLLGEAFPFIADHRNERLNLLLRFPAPRGGGSDRLFHRIHTSHAPTIGTYIQDIQVINKEDAPEVPRFRP